jgi:hypothetical protein
MTCIDVADEIAHRLEKKIMGVPDGFYDSFNYIKTGTNLSHPITWASLTFALAAMPQVATVGIDLRLNLGGGIKFQPDVVGWDDKDDLAVLLDYESPNSSDARIPVKDVDACIAWRHKSRSQACYIIVTTLPDRPTPGWQLRYASEGQCNHGFRDRRAEIRASPCAFWYGYYREQLAMRDAWNIAMVNINGKTVRRMYPQ